MKIRLIDYAMKQKPERKHYNDAGADVRACIDEPIGVNANSSVKIPLGFGVELPDGFMGLLLPRSGLASKGITCETPPIDSGYRGQIYAVITNNTTEPFVIEPGDRIAQLVVVPVVMADFTTDMGEERKDCGFGSTGVQ